VSVASQYDNSVCSWYQLVLVVNKSVRQMALKPLSRATIFVIAGDHAPPFDRQEIRDEFSSTEVPYVILLPRAQASPLTARN
jgi:hypothetical protein